MRNRDRYGPKAISQRADCLLYTSKASQETVEAFYAVTEAHAGWVLGYTLERAIAALKRELESEA